MRIFKILCVDRVTNMQMVASETSYNHSMSYLIDTLGYKPLSCTMDSETGYHKAVMEKEGNVYVFYYDEDRGYLLFDGEGGASCKMTSAG